MSFVRYGSRLFTNKPSTVGYLVRYGSRLKTETENNVFCYGSVKNFDSLKIQKIDFYDRHDSYMKFYNLHDFHDSHTEFLDVYDFHDLAFSF